MTVLARHILSRFSGSSMKRSKAAINSGTKSLTNAAPAISAASATTRLELSLNAARNSFSAGGEVAMPRSKRTRARRSSNERPGHDKPTSASERPNIDSPRLRVETLAASSVSFALRSLQTPPAYSEGSRCSQRKSRFTRSASERALPPG